MLKDITLGQYFPGNSILHRADPRTKILLVLVVMIALFVCSNWLSLLILGCLIVGMVYVSRLRLRMVLRGLKPLVFIIVFTAVLNLFMTPGEEIIWRAGPLSITTALSLIHI